MYVFKINGNPYAGIQVVELEQEISIVSGEESGRTQSGSMFIDAIGTYYNYTVTFYADPSPAGQILMNTFLYDLMTPRSSLPGSPGMIVEFPHDNAYLSFGAYNTTAKRKMKIMKENGNVWEGYQIKFTALEPQRRPL